MAEERDMDKVWQNNFLKKLVRHLCNLRTIIPLVLVLLGVGMYFLPQTRLHRAAGDQLYVLLQEGQVQNLRQLVTADNSTARRIMWQSSSPMESPRVAVRLAGREDSELFYDAEQDFWSDDGSENYQYTVLVDKLQPGTEYEYAVIDKDSRSGWYRLKTDSAGQPFKMLIFPDSQSADYSGWQQLAQEAWERNQGAELVVNMGDLVDNGEDSSQWRAWFRGLDNIISQSAFAPVMGNHECYDKIGRCACQLPTWDIFRHLPMAGANMTGIIIPLTMVRCILWCFVILIMSWQSFSRICWRSSWLG